nr:peptidoglycan editing factor PgeF [uncultured Noviherbaspirillum sp.]
MTSCIVPDWAAMPATVGALSTTRGGGVSAAPFDDGAGGGGLNLGSHVGDDAGSVMRNRAILQAQLPGPPVWLNQVHGADVVDAATVTGVLDADASIATRPGVVCAIMTADCLPVLFADRAGTVVGAAHAGWRGLAQGVLQNTVARMRQAGATDITAWLGPAIGPQAFEVGAEVRAAFADLDPAAADAFAMQPGGKYLADIYRLARLALAGCGVRQVDGGDFCTVSDEARFYSYRRDRVSGRMASLVWIKPALS